MSDSPKFLFDECVGKPTMIRLKELLDSSARFDHLCDIFRAGDADDEWLPRLRAEGNWIVITGDRARQSGCGPKLPDICRELGITHVLLSKAIHHKTTLEKIAALVLVWRQIEKCHLNPPGTRFQLKYRTTKSGGLSLVLEEDKPTKSAVGKRKVDKRKG